MKDFTYVRKDVKEERVVTPACLLYTSYKGQNKLEVTLADDTNNMDEVVVTAKANINEIDKMCIRDRCRNIGINGCRCEDQEAGIRYCTGTD